MDHGRWWILCQTLSFVESKYWQTLRCSITLSRISIVNLESAGVCDSRTLRREVDDCIFIANVWTDNSTLNFIIFSKRNRSSVTVNIFSSHFSVTTSCNYLTVRCDKSLTEKRMERKEPIHESRILSKSRATVSRRSLSFAWIHLPWNIDKQDSLFHRR